MKKGIVGVSASIVAVVVFVLVACMLFPFGKLSNKPPNSTI